MPHGGRHMFWTDTLLNDQISSNSFTSQTLLQDIDPTESRNGMTLTRTLICLDIGHFIHDSGEGSQMVTMGIGVAPSIAIIGSNTPQPEVATEFPTRGWVWRCRYRTFGFAADQPAVFNRNVHLDIRSQRKLDNGDLFLRVQNSNLEGATGTILVTGIIRTLWMSS